MKIPRAALGFPLPRPSRAALGSLEGMGRLQNLVREHHEEINEIVRRHHGRSVSLFGSVARGEESISSDIDFLVEFERGSDLFDLMRVQDELVELLGVKVDVVSAGGLKARDEHIRREAVLI